MIDWRHFHTQIATSDNRGMDVPSFSPAWNSLFHRKFPGSATVGNSSRMLSGLSGRKSIFKGLWSLDTPQFWLSSWGAGAKEVIKNGVLFCSPGWPKTHCEAQDGFELVIVNENSCKEDVFAESDWLVRTPALWKGWNWNVAGLEPDCFFLLPGTAIPCPPSSELTSCDW